MKYLILALFFITPRMMNAQRNANYDESKVPNYELPSILGKAETISDWENERRKELLALFESEVYGKTNLEGVQSEYKVTLIKEDALGGTATMKEVLCTLQRNGKKCSFNLIIFLPKAKSNVPIFLGLNFYGNHTISEEKEVSISPNWIPNKEEFKIINNKANELSRGVRAYRWPIKDIIARGYGLANIYCGDLDPDFDDGFQNGIHEILEKTTMGTIGAWAVGLSRAMDYFEQDKDIDSKKVALIGHSRLGKAALWASAQDTRFAITISNESGCGGAALSKRAYGETVQIINTSFPHWFCNNFKNYNNKESKLPIDQHQLLSLIAPRALYVASAEGDQWSDPRGEYLSLYHTNEIYQLYAFDPIPSESPALNHQQLLGRRGYHIRQGKHEVEAIDWEFFLNFADHMFK